MLGTYRLCLALLVALSHIGKNIHGLIPGIIAVVGFYLVSGYVMTGLLRQHYRSVNQVGKFYLDRALRLFPHYLAMAGITFIWFSLTGQHTDYLKGQPNSMNILNNILIVPLNFYMFNNAMDFTLIPPSWSLGAEIQFYLVVPFLLLFDFRKIAITLSLSVFVAATFGILNSDWFGYRLLPGVLFTFLLGSLLYDRHQSSQVRLYGKRLLYSVTALVFVLGGLLTYSNKIRLPYNRETLIGLIVGLFFLNTLARRARNSFDEALGNLSYGVFLNHFFVKWAFFGEKVEGFLSVTVYLALSLFIAFVMSRLVEGPILKFRKRMRRAKAATVPAMS